jgi:hypothetical protein
MTAPHPFGFFERLVWLDGRPLMDTIEPYRRAIFEAVLYTFDHDGRLHFNFALCGRAKKNWKTSDLILAGLYRLLAWPVPGDAYILANDAEQARDDLSLAKKLIAANAVLKREVSPLRNEIRRRDGRGVMAILPAGDVAGAHGKTFSFIGYDEIHAYRTHDLFEALAPDPTRLDALTWVTSYAGIRHAPGIPLYDFLMAGKRGDDPRMFFSWFAADYTTDPGLAGEDVSPEERANPSLASWGNDGYLDQQRRRLPTHRYRRLHLNLPGAPDGAAFDGEAVMGAIVPGRKRLRPVPGVTYIAFVDMSGGSSDDAVLAIAHEQDGRLILDLVEAQTGAPPFNPRDAVRKFAALLKEYGIREVVGDAFAGQTFRADFEAHGINYELAKASASDLYEWFEPLLNAGEVELLDVGKLQEQLLTLVWRGQRIDHQAGDHDDWANAAVGALVDAGSGADPVESRGAFRFARQEAARLSQPVEEIGVAEAISIEEFAKFDQHPEPARASSQVDYSSQAYRDELAEGQKALVRRDSKLRGARTSGAATGPLARLSFVPVKIDHRAGPIQWVNGPRATPSVQPGSVEYERQRQGGER